MTIEWTCSCGLKLKAQDDAAGKQTQCPKCSQSLVIPAGAPESAGDDDRLYDLASGPGVEEQAPRGLVCPFCGCSDVAYGTNVCRNCRLNIFTGVAARPLGGGVDAAAEPGRLGMWLGALLEGHRRWRPLLIVGILLLVFCLLWFAWPGANRAKLKAMERELQSEFGGRHVRALRVDIPYIPLSVPQELDVSAEVRYGAPYQGRYRYRLMRGKYTPGAIVLKLSGGGETSTLNSKIFRLPDHSVLGDSGTKKGGDPALMITFNCRSCRRPVQLRFSDVEAGRAQCPKCGISNPHPQTPARKEPTKKGSDLVLMITFNCRRCRQQVQLRFSDVEAGKAQCPKCGISNPHPQTPAGGGR